MTSAGVSPQGKLCGIRLQLTREEKLASPRDSIGSHIVRMMPENL
jgi:hypothetical protein